MEKNGISVYKLDTNYDKKLVCEFFKRFHADDLDFDKVEFYYLADYLGRNMNLEPSKVVELFIGAIEKCDLDFIEFLNSKNDRLIRGSFKEALDDRSFSKFNIPLSVGTRVAIRSPKTNES